MSEIPPLCAGDLAELDELSRHVIGIGNDAFDRGERTREQLLDLPGYKMATGIQRLMAESKAFRKRNEKLERLLREASNCRAKSFCVHSLNIYRVDFEAFFDLLDALSELDKEE